MASRTSGCGSGRCCSTRTASAKDVGCGWRMPSGRRCPRRSRRFSRACAKKGVDPLEPRARIVELEQLLLRQHRQRQDLGETRADPGGRLQVMRRGKELAVLLDHALEEADGGLARRGN